MRPHRNPPLTIRVLAIAAAALALACSPPAREAPTGAPEAPPPACPPLAETQAETQGRATSAAPRQVIQGTHAGRILDIAFAPSGRLVATTADDGTLRVWDATSLHELLVARLGGGGSVTWLPGEAAVVVGIQRYKDGEPDFVAWRVEIATGEKRQVAWEDAAPREASAIQERIADGRREVMEAAQRALPRFSVSDAARLRDGRRILACGVRRDAQGEGSLVLFDAASGKVERELRFPYLGARDQWVPSFQDLKPIALSPDGTRAAMGSWEGRVWMVSAETGALIGALGGDLAPRLAREVEISSDGRLVMLSEDHVSVFSLGDGARSGSFWAPGAVRIAREAAEGGGALRVVGAREKGCLSADPLDLKRGPKREAPRCDLPRILDAASEGYRIAAEAGARILLWDHTEARILDLAAGASRVIGKDEPRCALPSSPAAFADDGSFLVTSTARGRSGVSTLCVFDGESGATKGVLELPRAPQQAIAQDASSIGLVVGGELVVHALPGGARAWGAPVAEEERLVALGPGGRVAVVRSNGRVRVIREGREVSAGDVAPEEPAPSRMDAAGRWGAAIGEDGGVRVWDLERAAHLVTIVEFRDEEWITLTPAGAYAGTTEVGDRVGWVFGSPLEHFSFEQFASVYRDPKLVARRLGGDPGDALPARARPPRVTIDGAPALDVSGRTARVRASFASEGRVDVLRAFVEGRPAALRAVCAPRGEVELEVPLLPGQNRVHLVAFDARGFASNASSVSLRAPRDPARRPDVWVVAVGVSTYPRLPEALQLGVAHEDARAIAAALSAHAEGPLRTYGRAHVTSLLNEQATPGAIRRALADLAAMRPEDVAVVFFAGHGFKTAPRGDMVFAASGVRLNEDGKGVAPESARDDTIAWADIAEGLGRARGRVVVLLDACHSGHVSQELVVPNAALASGLSQDGRAGAIVFAAAKGRQLSLEPKIARALQLDAQEEALVAPAKAEPHGFFTGAVLAALEDAATDRDASGTIEIGELTEEVTRRVTRATRGAQTPWIARKDMFGDFAIIERAPR